MKEPVYFIKTADQEPDDLVAGKLRKLIEEKNLFGFIEKNDMIAVKTHFGETPKSGYIRPLHIKVIGDLVKEKKGKPFLTETSTLYKGNRNNALDHIAHAHNQGFGYEATGMPVIMADGLYGDEEAVVDVPGKLYSSVNIASLVKKIQGMVVASHFTGHLGAGFGAALKNLGMGLSSRKGKMTQHSTARPSIIVKKCTRCGMCVKWCPAEAVTLNEASAVIDSVKCIGCGQCLAVCRFDAVGYNWGATYDDLQKKVVEHAWGVHRVLEKKIIYINYLTRVSKDCDCMTVYEKIVPDIGVLVSADPVAIDAASLDLVEQAGGKGLGDLAYDIPYRVQLEYAREIGFGSDGYNLIEA
ncbi:MAG TPA: DUF362 domain-containing protein [Spirochaetota bacterium]|nr:DUF362 domain-containing protein [Spirochaetota bacterium]HQP49422.1 DUF362 domain-containing protein [Spirochaetota bacterium]